jgi:hypothetical protein
MMVDSMKSNIMVMEGGIYGDTYSLTLWSIAGQASAVPSTIILSRLECGGFH